MEKKNLVVEHFASIENFVNAIDGRKENRVYAKKGVDLSSKTGSESFTGTKRYEEAIDLLKNGYEEPLQEIQRSVKKLAAKSNTPIQKPRPTIGVVGFAPCVPNAIKGLPNSMIGTQRVPVKSKILTIYYSIAVNAGYSKVTIIKAGTAMLKIVNDLELRGYRVKLDVELMGTEEANEFASCTVTIKDWRQHLDLKKLCFPLIHPSAFRRLGFRWLETVEQLTENGYIHGYGRPKANASYEAARSFYEENGITDKSTYYLNIPMIQHEEYDVEKIMNRCGMKEVK